VRLILALKLDLEVGLAALQTNSDGAAETTACHSLWHNLAMHGSTKFWSFCF
jgi:hypothetical protein